MSALSTLFWGIVTLGLLVFVHELGHFLAARAFGVRVTEFMIGMPGPSVGIQRGDTRYGVTAIPLGGYNRICGMEAGPEYEELAGVLAYVYRHGSADLEHVALGCGLDEDDAKYALVVLDGWGSINKPGRCNNTDKWCAPARGGFALGQAREVDDPEALLAAERSVTYRALNFWRRLVVLAAGPLFSLLLAVAVFVAIYSGVGVWQACSTLYSEEEGAPAALAGLQEGDTITSLGGIEVATAEEFSSALLSFEPGDTITITYLREGAEQTTEATLGENESGAPMLGVYLGYERVHLSVWASLKESASYIVQTVQAYGSLFNPQTAAETVSESSSVVGIAVMASQAASYGWLSWLYLLAAVSLALGVMNLLPLPPLDGGRILIEIIQKIIGRELSANIVNGLTMAMMALLLVLFVVLIGQDLQNFVFNS